MKLTANGLRRLIKEEYRRVLRESGAIPTEFAEPSHEPEIQRLSTEVDDLRERLGSLEMSKFDPELAEELNAKISELNRLLDDEEEFHLGHQLRSSSQVARDDHQGHLTRLGGYRR
jgi:hypothetical protein